MADDGADDSDPIDSVRRKRARQASRIAQRLQRSARARRQASPPSSSGSVQDDPSTEPASQDTGEGPTALGMATLRGHVEGAKGFVRVQLLCEAEPWLSEVTGMPSEPFVYAVTEPRTGGDYGPIDLLEGLSCEVRAMRYDGVFRTRSGPGYLTAQADDELWVDLALPKERTGGIGIALQQLDDGGFVAQRVYSGTPAFDAGLEAGDRIVEVDGLPTDTLTLDEFLDVMTGPEGTQVEFYVEAEGDTGLFEERHVLTRESMDASALEG
jgi:hypothetical protein